MATDAAGSVVYKGQIGIDNCLHSVKPDTLFYFEKTMMVVAYSSHLKIGFNYYECPS